MLDLNLILSWCCNLNSLVRPLPPIASTVCHNGHRMTEDTSHQPHHPPAPCPVHWLPWRYLSSTTIGVSLSPLKCNGTQLMINGCNFKTFFYTGDTLKYCSISTVYCQVLQDFRINKCLKYLQNLALYFQCESESIMMVGGLLDNFKWVFLLLQWM